MRPCSNQTDVFTDRANCTPQHAFRWHRIIAPHALAETGHQASSEDRRPQVQQAVGSRRIVIAGIRKEGPLHGTSFSRHHMRDCGADQEGLLRIDNVIVGSVEVIDIPLVKCTMNVSITASFKTSLPTVFRRRFC